MLTFLYKQFVYETVMDIRLIYVTYINGLATMCVATLTREVAGSNPGKSHWWTTGRASGPKKCSLLQQSPN